MEDGEEYGALDCLRWEQRAPFYLDHMPDRLAGVCLQVFDEPGRWALTIEWDRDEEAHAVAVAVAGADRVLADNHVREPLPVETVLEQHPVYGRATVRGGLQLVPCKPLTFNAG